MKKVIISMVVCLAACFFVDSMAAVKPTIKPSDDFECWTLEAHSSNDDNLAVDQYCKICRFISLISGEGMLYFNLTTHEKVLEAVKKLPNKEFPSLGEVQYIPSLDVDYFQSVFVQKFIANREDLETALESYVPQITIVLQWLNKIQKNKDVTKEIKICIDELQSSQLNRSYFGYKTANDKLKQAQAVFDDKKLITFSAMVFYILYGAMKTAKLAF